MSAPVSRPKDVPELRSDGSNLREWGQAITEGLRTLRGFRGDGWDAAITKRNAVGVGLLNLDGTPAANGGSGIPGPAGPPGPPGTGTTPDLTPPPTPTGLTVTGGFAKLFIEWDAPIYTAGHGHKRTIIYGATFRPGVDPDPVFADAVVIAEAFDGRDLYAHPSELGVTWAIWLKFESNDGVKSTAPAGGANGVQATVGKVGNSDLGPLVVLAQNLAAGSVTADKTALDIGGSNLLANNSFEVDTDGDGLADGWIAYNNSSGSQPSTMSRTPGRIGGVAQRHAWSGANTTTKGVASSIGPREGWQPYKTYVISWYARANSAKASGMSCYWNINPATQTALKNPALTTDWQRYAYRITWGASVESSGIYLFLSITSGFAATGWLEFDDVQVEEGDTLSGYEGRLALNTIIAGDGAIANLAITNALIANLAVDAAKIADLAVQTAKIADLAVTNAKLANLSVTNAKIGNAAVDTLQIAGNAVTVPAASKLLATVPITNSPSIRDVLSVSVDSKGAPVIVVGLSIVATYDLQGSSSFMGVTLESGTSGDPNHWVQFGPTHNTNSLGGGQQLVYPVLGFDSRTISGLRTYTLRASKSGSGTINATAEFTTLVALGVQR